MKTILIICFVGILLFPIYSIAQCPPGEIILNSQAEVDAFSTNYPNCHKITGKFIIGYQEGSMLSDITDVSGLSAIDTITIGNNFYIRNNPSLNNLTGLNGLKYVGASSFVIENNNSLSNLTGLESLAWCNNFFRIRDNDNLQNLVGLESLNQVGAFFLSNNPALQSLQGWNGITSTTSIGQLALSNNDNLTNMSGLENLTQVFNLSISGCENLINLVGLESLIESGEGIFLRDNQNLTSLTGLSSLENSSYLDLVDNPNLSSLAAINRDLGIMSLTIKNNPLLSLCSVKAICQFLNSYSSLNVEIENNAPGCNTVEEISCIDFGLSGFVFYDFNQNKIKDPLEGGIVNQQVLITPDNLNLIPNLNGRYWLSAVENTSYELTWVDDPNWTLSTDSSSYHRTFIPGQVENDDNHFGLFSINPNHDFALNVTSSQARCNREVKYLIHCQNQGAFIENGEIEIQFNELPGFSNAFPEPSAVDLVNRVIRYEFNNLYPFASYNIKLIFDVPGPENIGDTIKVETTLYREDAGTPVEVAQVNYKSLILCSYDPNDKLVQPRGEGEEHYTLHDEKLFYTLRFQNTGNIDAINVEIRDTLDSNLDWTSFRLLNSSHEVFPSRTVDGAISFLFPNIYLPAESVDELGSQGFVTYEILPVAGLADFTRIENTGHIYFDENPPIVTNTTFNTMVDLIPTSTKELTTKANAISIFPNPTSNTFYVTTTNDSPIEEVLLYNQLGQLILKDKNRQIEVSHLPNGLYILNVKIDGVNWMEKLIIE